MKQLLQLTTCVLFMGLSCMAHAEMDNQALVKRTTDRPKEDIIFTFMRKSQFINTISEWAGKKTKTSDGKSFYLPFGDLYAKLAQKSKQLATAEQKNALRDEKKEKALKNAFEKSTSSRDIQVTYDLLKENDFIKDAIKEHPAGTELTELMVINLYDMKKLFEKLFKRDFNFKQIQNISKIVADFKLSKKEFLGLMNLAYNDEIEQYKHFVEENKEILEKVSKIANNEFKVKTVVKKCKPLKKKERCTLSSEEHAIKSLSEIIPNVSNLPHHQAIEVEAPSSKPKAARLLQIQ